MNRDCLEVIFESLGTTDEVRLQVWATVSRVSKEFGLIIGDMTARIPEKTRTVAQLRNVEVTVCKAERMGILPLDVTVRCRRKDDGTVVLSLGDLVERMNDDEYNAFGRSRRDEQGIDKESFENMYDLVFENIKNHTVD